MKDKLLLGCGRFAEDDYVNTDIVDLPGVDMILDASVLPWGFEDESFTEVKAIDVIEHLPPYIPDGRHTMIALMEEIWRILKPGGKVYFRTSDARFPEAWIDLTHTRTFMPQSFDSLDPETALGKDYGFYTDVKFHVDSVVEQNKGLNFTLYKLPKLT